MIDFADVKAAYMAGELQGNSAYVDGKLWGKFSFDIKSEFTRVMFELFESVLGVSKDRMYLTILEYETWGAKGKLK